MISDDLIFKIWACSLLGKFSNTKLCADLRDHKTDYITEYLNCNDIPAEILRVAESEIKQARQRNIRLITYWDEAYPEPLKHIADSALLLFVKGELRNQDALSIVGSRNCTDYGKKYSKIFSRHIAEREITVISGLATGIDSAAHRGAIESKKYPGIGVLGCGVEVYYPAHNRALYHSLLDAGGALISEFGLFAHPRNYLFPRRNRIISGLAKAVFVIESSLRSGSLITARLANEQGRDVLALPGPIDSEVSAGCNKLISEGAKIICSKQDLEDYLEQQNLGKASIQNEPNEHFLIQKLKSEAHTVESLSKSLEVPIQKLYAKLLTMELNGELNISITGQIELNNLK